MIAVRLQGRLGNQLFQYAFACSASTKIGTRFYIDEHDSPFLLDKYFELDERKFLVSQLFKISGYKNFFSHHLRRFYYRQLAKIFKFTVNEQPPEAILLSDKTLYIGFFQSESYFKTLEALIREKFNIKKTFIEEFSIKYKALYTKNTVVTVHVRRTDYRQLSHLNLGNHDLTLPLSYYNKAIAQFGGQNVHFVFITDDHDFVNENFKEVNNKTISTDTEIADLQHLINADACIIANSTFSWWGAWLNNNSNKIIYCPRFFMGYYLQKEVPENIYPPEWRQIAYDLI